MEVLQGPRGPQGNSGHSGHSATAPLHSRCWPSHGLTGSLAKGSERLVHMAARPQSRLCLHSAANAVVTNGVAHVTAATPALPYRRRRYEPASATCCAVSGTKDSTCCGRISQGTDRVRRAKPSDLMCSTMLPGEDGPDLRPCGPRTTPAHISSPHVEDVDRIAPRGGAKRLLPKPFNPPNCCPHQKCCAPARAGSAWAPPRNPRSSPWALRIRPLPAPLSRLRQISLTRDSAAQGPVRPRASRSRDSWRSWRAAAIRALRPQPGRADLAPAKMLEPDQAQPRYTDRGAWATCSSGWCELRLLQPRATDR